MDKNKVKGNVLVVGNSGVGKSTLINAILGENLARMSFGEKGTTSEVVVYEKDDCPFNLVDTVGFEPQTVKEMQAVKGIRKWSKENAKDGNAENDINVIWFCVDGMATKLFPKTLKDLDKATSVWKRAPIIVVITKSFSDDDRDNNINMVHAAIEKNKRLKENLNAVIPVVALEVKSGNTVAIPPAGIGELIEATEQAMPEGRTAAKKDVRDFVLRRRKALSQGIIAGAVASAAAIGAAPMPIADAVILVPIEGALVKALAKVYGIKDDEESQQVMESIVNAGTVGVAAKAIISATKAIPGINIAAAALNAAVAGSIVLGIGEVSTTVFERLYIQELDWKKDPNWLDKIIKEVFSESFVNEITKAIEEYMKDPDLANLPKVVTDLALNLMARFDNSKDGKK